jgi:STE24 endopeptidase
MSWNAYAVVVLAALVLEHALGVLADALNLRALAIEPPAALRGVYAPERYARSQQYTRTRTSFGFVTAAVDLGALLAFWLAGGFGVLDRWASGLGFGPIATGLVFIGALLLAKSLLALPFSYYSTFVIEERFGFNKSTRATFFADAAKGLVIGGSIGALVLAAVIWFFERFGAGAWLWCWGLVTVLTIALQFVAPTWIMPLFNKFTPLEEGDLRARILAYAERVGFPLAGLFVIDGSKRSTKANAFFTGFGKTKRVALYDTLIEKHETDELLAVVAHEIGHYKKRHILQSMLVSIVHMGVLFALLSYFLREPELFRAFGVETPSVAAGLVFFGLLYTPVELLLQIGMQAFSRKNEYEADRFAAETTGLWRELSAGLKKLSAENLSNLTPHPFYVALHHSHPPLAARLGALEREWGENER